MSSPPAVLIEVLATTLEAHATPVAKNLVIAMGWSRARGEMMYEFTFKVLHICTNYKQAFHLFNQNKSEVILLNFSVLVCFSGVAGWYQ